MEINELHNCTFWMNIEDTSACFKVGRPDDSTGVNITKVLANNEWQVILPVQVNSLKIGKNANIYPMRL